MLNQVPQDLKSSASDVSAFKMQATPTKTIAQLAQDEQARQEWLAKVEQLRRENGAVTA